MTTKHGGHLGFFEGGTIVPDEITWLDRIIIEYADAITSLYLRGKLPGHTDIIQDVVETSQPKPVIEQQTGFYESKEENSVELDLRKRNITTERRNKTADAIDNQGNRGSLKRGAILQATSFVQ